MEVGTVARQLPCSDKSVLLEEYVPGLSNDESAATCSRGVIGDVPENFKVCPCCLREVE